MNPMDNVDYLYVRVRTEELLARIGESEAVNVTSSGMAAAPPNPSRPPCRRGLWRRLRRAIQLRRRSIRILPDSTS